MKNLSVLLLLLAVLVNCAVAQYNFTVKPIPGYKTCDQVRFDDGDIGPDGNVSDPLFRFRPHPLDAQLFSDGGAVSYPAPNNSFEIIVYPPPGWQPVRIGGVPKLLNGSIVGINLRENKNTLQISSVSGSNVPLRPVYHANGTVTYTTISVHSTNQVVFDYGDQIQAAMFNLKRRLAAVGLTLDYVATIDIYLHKAEGHGRPYLGPDMFSQFHPERRPHTITLETGFISPLYAVELNAMAYRPKECIKKWYR